ncbi:MAG TPA: sigma-70 family RNA polymerase sigma factor [Polyangiaceae bacterium]|jgi:RNA polymerase sigma-70 factor (ECF subfamily)|nr:sigma-70 family RNA polymerase sigma factor [Polyangiaceae bacterium]
MAKLSPTPAQISRFPAERLGDAELVRAAARGDADAVAVVWERYAGLVRGVLRGALGPDSAIEDLSQEVFVGFLRGAKNIQEGAALRGYLVGVAVRLAALELRRRKIRRWVTLTPTGTLPERMSAPADAEGRQALAALHRVLDGVSSRRRMAFVLRHVQGLEILDVAASLNISESTARRELDRARTFVLKRAEREPALRPYLARMAGGAA